MRLCISLQIYRFAMLCAKFFMQTINNLSCWGEKKRINEWDVWWHSLNKTFHIFSSCEKSMISCSWALKFSRGRKARLRAREIKTDSVNWGLAAVKEKRVVPSLRKQKTTSCAGWLQKSIREGEIDGGETVRCRCANHNHKRAAGIMWGQRMKQRKIWKG